MAEKLSPAAQAVRRAAASAYWAEEYEVASPDVIAAAALRAAVDQCAMKREIHPDSLLTESIIEADDLLAIAQELENHHD